LQDVAASSLTTWENFYVITGSAAAALTGLMFVVVTLIAGTSARRSGRTFAAFGTPTVIHFCAALLIAAILSAPWPMLWPACLLLGISGIGGVAYIIVVILRARHQTEYMPVLEDWLWHTIFPLIAYTVLLVAAVLLLNNPILAMFGMGAVTVLLLFIGIHNAWDTVTYIAITYSPPESEK
jgi:hypothetical protein